MEHTTLLTSSTPTASANNYAAACAGFGAVLRSAWSRNNVASLEVLVPDLDDVRDMLADEHGLAVVSTTQRDGRVLSSVVNCGLSTDPVSGAPSVALVSRGDAARLAHIRRGSAVTIVVRRSWEWVGVTGPARLIGPDDPADGVDAEALRLLLRQVYQDASGAHDDYDEYDRVMAAERRTCVFVQPDRINGR